MTYFQFPIPDRFFWIQWNAEDPSVRVGRGNALYEGEILVAKGSDLEKYNIQSSLDQIIAVSISTTISNIGYWRFNIPAKGNILTFDNVTEINFVPQLTLQT